MGPAFGHDFWGKNAQWPLSAIDDIDRILLGRKRSFWVQIILEEKTTSGWFKFHFQNSNMFEELICQLPGEKPSLLECPTSQDLPTKGLIARCLLFLSG